MADKYLNTTGLTYLWGRLEALFLKKADLPTIPTKTSDLTNDGDGTDSNSPFSTQAYVLANGGKIDVIKVNGIAQSITNKEVDLSVPTATNDLTNDSGFITNAVSDLVNYYTKSQTYTQAEVNQLIGSISTVNFEIVQTLPTQDISTSTIYLVPKSSSQTQNVYDEYVYINNAWELIGTTNIDLSSYWTSTAGETNSLIAITTSEIDNIINAS